MAALAACDGSAPYSNIIDTTGRGVGFSDYAQYMRAQEELSRIRRAEAEQARGIRAPANAPQFAQQQRGQSAEPGNIAQEAVAAVRGGAAQQQTQTAQAPVPQFPVAQSQPAQPAQQQAGAPLSAIAPISGSQPDQLVGTSPRAEAGVSEQQFTPQPFGTAQPDQLIERDFVPQVRVSQTELGQGSGGPNLFVYALSTQHNVGQVRYNRSHPLRWRRWEAACAQFPTQDLAQEAFLAAGGPERDPNHLDPDGDGFACWWDPAPFRQAARTVRARE